MSPEPGVVGVVEPTYPRTPGSSHPAPVRKLTWFRAPRDGVPPPEASEVVPLASEVWHGRRRVPQEGRQAATRRVNLGPPALPAGSSASREKLVATFPGPDLVSPYTRKEVVQQ